METIKTFSADSEDLLWSQVAADMAQDPQMLQYSAQLIQGGQSVYFDIDIDLGGGFESGFSTTNFLVPLPGTPALRFHLHKQDWVNELGKVFGQEDVKLGYPELDDAFIVKTNQPEALQALFADAGLRAFLFQHQDCELELKEDDAESGTLLTFSKDEALVEAARLQEVYHWLRELAVRLSQ